MAKNLVHGAKQEAKKESTLAIGERYNLQWYDLHSFPERNSRVDSWRDPLSDLEQQIRPLIDNETDVDRKTTADGLVHPMLQGWDELQAAYVEITIPTPDESKLAIAQRRQILDEYRTKGTNAKTEVYGRIANFIESLWFPGGQPCEIKGIVNMSYRRMQALPGVVFARKVRGIDSLGNYTIPVIVRQYADALTAYMRHVDENLGKDAGRSDYSAVDYLKIAADIQARGGSEANLRKYAKVGESQRAFRLMNLHSRFPQVHLLERFLRKMPALVNGKTPYYPPGGIDPETNSVDPIGCWLPYRKVDKEVVQGLLTNKDFKSDVRPISKAPDIAVTAKTAEEFAAWIVDGGSRVANWGKDDVKKFFVQAKPVAVQTSGDGGKAAVYDTASREVLQFMGWCMEGARRDALDAFLTTYGPAIETAVKGAGFDSAAWQAAVLKGSTLPPAE